ncbi:MAG: M50 family metallopeptidase [Dermatophilaceae bacterium]
MTWVYFALGVVFMAVGVAGSIALHEVGHLVPAKRFGVRVTQYMVGFGPTIWSRRRGETEYGIKAIPLGGFIRMIGMFPPRPGEAPGTVRASSTGRFSQLIDEARAATLEEMRPGDENRVFYTLSVPKKVVVMLGGPLMNLLIGVVLLTVLVTAHGVQELQTGAKVESIAECVVPADDATTATSCRGRAPTPALAAGLRPGDVIREIDGVPIENNRGVSAAIRPRIGQQVELVVERGDAQVRLTATPIRNVVTQVDAEGVPVTRPDGQVATTEAGFLGVTSSTPMAYVRQPLSAVPAILGDGIVRTAIGLVNIPERMVGVWNAVVGDAEREIDSPMSVVGVGRIAGEVTSGRLDALVGGEPIDRFFFLVSLLAYLNLMLFVFNLVPLLPLDGGHVAGALWEGLKRLVARILKRPDPGYVDVARALPLAYTVSIALLGMTLLLVYADLVNPVRLGG